MTAKSWVTIALLLFAAAMMLWFEVAHGEPQAVWECQQVGLCPAAGG